VKSAKTTQTPVAQASKPAVSQVSNLRAVALEKRIRTWLPLYFHRVIRVSFQIAMKYPG
jgi:hypothetical protein